MTLRTLSTHEAGHAIVAATLGLPIRLAEARLRAAGLVRLLPPLGAAHPADPAARRRHSTVV